MVSVCHDVRIVPTNSDGSCNWNKIIAEKDNFSNALTAKSGKTDAWIVDSSASDHMTGDASLFQNYNSILRIKWLELLMKHYPRWNITVPSSISLHLNRPLLSGRKLHQPRTNLEMAHKAKDKASTSKSTTAHPTGNISEEGSQNNYTMDWGTTLFG